MTRWYKIHWREVLISLMILSATGSLYFPVRHFDFVNYDDPAYITENPYVRQGLARETLLWAFRADWNGKDPNSDYWHPLSYLSHALDVELFGLNPGAHHLMNVGLHAASATALFLALRLLTGSVWRSALVAALFAVHPQRVKSVAWVTERKDVLSGLFFFLTLWAYARYARMSNVEGRKSKAGLVTAGNGMSLFRPLTSGWYWATLLRVPGQRHGLRRVPRRRYGRPPRPGENISPLHFI